ncbi:deoxyribodipyrimidine photo-lyase [Pedobacter cryoconitis]|uniref:Deoxyribodipyrimidine photo-lyase n=1 Tax=Pedobacter cryoconitis TaxID=188932 RepID=A0A7W8ZLX0_9SPHI|nr:deoxyribodipyrimidine photo-lyase [Pedobacter cryoconitis]MBB5636447.1 deoxyribodipyrimidine photo-lyase [Pedobacter cryoconitis]
MKTEKVNICWLRRDLRLQDNAALYHALKSNIPVLLLFIFDRNILDDLNDPKDARVTFIYKRLKALEKELEQKGSSLLIRYGVPEQIWPELLQEYSINAVYTNHDYEPYAKDRDDTLAEYLRSEDISFHSYKDQVIFERKEILKSDGKPYTVFTPYFRQWKMKLNDFYVKSYPVEKYDQNFFQTKSLLFPELAELGFEESELSFPAVTFEEKLAAYEERRDFPADDATTRLGIHLRFGTVSIRAAANSAIQAGAEKWLSELAWRDFYMMILYHFPHIVTHSFKPAYDQIKWLNKAEDFEAWKNGKTGYPIVDAGMNQLNQTGYMHNRVRMIVGSFLTKHLLIDWRWGETYFAEKLLDYELASNVGGWQWACGCGNDAAPYFRVFNPELQAKKFDPENKYIYKWAPEYKQGKHVQPIVDHAFARERILKVFKEALKD